MPKENGLGPEAYYGRCGTQVSFGQKIFVKSMHRKVGAEILLSSVVLTLLKNSN